MQKPVKYYNPDMRMWITFKSEKAKELYLAKLAEQERKRLDEIRNYRL